jgi:hypothetical protein
LAVRQREQQQIRCSLFLLLGVHKVEIIINQSNRQMTASKVLGDELVRMGIARSIDKPASRVANKQTYSTRHLEAQHANTSNEASNNSSVSNSVNTNSNPKTSNSNARVNQRNARPKQFGK